MLGILNDNIYVQFSGQIFFSKHSMGHIVRPLFADLFLNGYEAEFIQGLLKVIHIRNTLIKNWTSPTGSKMMLYL